MGAAQKAMSTDEPSTERASTGATPADVYSRRLHALNLEQTAESRHERLLGYCKLTLAAVALVAALLFLHFLRHLEFLLAAVVAFLILAVLHEKVLARLRIRARAIGFYERGMARLEDRWAGTGESGERFLDPLHP